MTTELHNVLLAQIAGIFAPLLSVRDDEDLIELLDMAGWDLEALAGVDVSGAVTAAGNAEQAIIDVVAAISNGTGELEEYAGAAAKLAQPIAEFVLAVKDWTPPVGLDADDIALIPVDLVAILLDTYLRQTAPRAAAVLAFLGILKQVPGTPLALTNGTVVRRAMDRPEIDLEVLQQAVTDPIGLLTDRFLNDPDGNRLLAEQIADLVGPFLVELVDAAGGAGSYGVPAGGAGLGMSTDEVDAARHMLMARWDFDLEATAQFLLALGLTDDTAGRGLGVVVAPSGEMDASAGPVQFILAGNPGAVLITSAGADFDTAGATLTLTIGYTSPTDPAVRFGAATGTRFEIGETKVLVAGEYAASSIDFGISIELNRIVLAIAGGDGDGFLSKVLPKEPITAGADLGMDWTVRKGLKVRGSGSLEIRIAAHLMIGPISLDEVVLALGFNEAGLFTSVAVDATLAIGPIVAAVQGIGLRAALSPAAEQTVAVSFKPPHGIGFALDAGPVKGGGLVAIDEPAHQYVGILYLDIAGVVTVTAIGILTTKLPDGSDGFSLLVLITAEFPPIQLGYGFALIGLGGLVGINRTFVVEALQAGVRTGALGAILFPKNPVANATQLISTLKTVFPPAAGHYVFGPMVKLGWGPNALLAFELGLLVELPSPLRLVVIGKITVVLPDKDAAVVQLRLDVLGVLDFARGEVSIDASLIDSRIAVFNVSGDMALRAGWKESKGFAVAVGGFHPKFTPPPGFPALQRLAISLATSDNPRIRLETYFAVTSNSIQFGGKLDVFVAAGPFTARGYAGLDALIELSPFHLVITLSVGIDIKWNGTPLMHAQLEGVLEGPNPWHAYGFVEFQVLFVSGRIAVDVVIGEPAPEEPVRIDLGEVLRAALLADDAWSVELPPAGATGVSLRSRSDRRSGDVTARPVQRATAGDATRHNDQPLWCRAARAEHGHSICHQLDDRRRGRGAGGARAAGLLRRCPVRRHDRRREAHQAGVRADAFWCRRRNAAVPAAGGSRRCGSVAHRRHVVRRGGRQRRRATDRGAAWDEVGRHHRRPAGPRRRSRPQRPERARRAAAEDQRGW